MKKAFGSNLFYSNHIKPFRNSIIKKCCYTMPKKYAESFYLANAELFDCVNWFIHKAYEVVYEDLVCKAMQVTKMDSKKARRAVCNAITYMEYCNNFIDVNLPMRLENSAFDVVRGFRAQHGLYYMQRPCLGGFRMCEDVEKDHVKALAALSTYKHACVGINMAGAHGGLRICKEDYSLRELKKAVQNFAKEVGKRGFCGSYLDIYEPDMYCKPYEIAWFIGSISASGSDHMPASCVAGKPFACEGIEDYDCAGGESAYIVLNRFLENEELMKKIEMKPGLKDKTFIIQGLGKIGEIVATYLEEAGVKCIGFKEIDCYGYDDSEGFSVQELLKYKKDKNTLQDFNSNVANSDEDTVLFKECDILVLSATHKTMQCYQADCVQAKVVLEAALLAVTPSAHKILTCKNKLVVPDILATAGTSVVSYCEYVKSLTGKPFGMIEGRHTAELVKSLIATNKNLEESKNVPLISEMLFSRENSMVFATMGYMLNNSIKDVEIITEKYKLHLDFRTAAYIHSINRIFNSILECRMY